jgi:hypothetical protein
MAPRAVRQQAEAEDEATSRRIRDDAMRALGKRKVAGGEDEDDDNAIVDSIGGSSAAGTARKTRAVDALAGIARAIAPASTSPAELELRRKEMESAERVSAADLDLRRATLDMQREDARQQADLRLAELSAQSQRATQLHEQAMAAQANTQQAILAAIQAMTQAVAMFAPKRE